MGTRASVEQLGVVAGELRRRERAEHELAVEAQEVEGSASFRGIEGPQRVPALGLHQRAFELDCRLLVAAACLGVYHRLLGHRARAAKVEGTDPVAELGVGIADEPVGRLHQMAVGVEVRASLGVGHEVFSFDSDQTPACSSAGRGARFGLGIGPAP